MTPNMQEGWETLSYSEDTLKNLNGRSRDDNKLPVAFSNDKTITPELEKVIEVISFTGLLCYPWQLVQDLLVAKLEQVT
jgi:hypothetical protein